MSGELEKELRGAVAHEKKMGVQGGWMEDLGSLLDTIDALRTELATERAAREKAERERDALEEVARIVETSAGWIGKFNRTPGASMPKAIATAIRALTPPGEKT